MPKLRLRFSKTGASVWMSHLDLMRTLTRAIKRAGLPIKYSEGFNPHASFSIAMPLPVGVSSVCELSELTLTDEIDDKQEMAHRLSGVLPDGITALELYEGAQSFSGISFTRVEGELLYDAVTPGHTLNALSEFFSAPSMPVTKRTKRGVKTLDIVPSMRELELSCTDGGLVRLSVILSAQSPVLNPPIITEALRSLAPKELIPSLSRFTRIELLDAEMRPFR